MMVYVVLIAATFGKLACISASPTSPWRKLDWKKCVGEEKAFQHAAVATDNPLCSSVGSYFLEKGGNVLDAAVGIQACQTVVDCHLTGFGGGGRMLLYKKSLDQFFAISANPKIYKRFTMDVFKEKGGCEENKKGGAFVGIPTILLALWEAHENFGNLPWRDLFEPAIEIAENGFPLGAFMRAALTKRPYLEVQSDPILRRIFVDPETGDVKEIGSLIKMPVLARTLQRIALNGAEDFYKGSLAEEIVADINEKGGLFELDDMRDYQPSWMEPLKMNLNGTFRGLTVYNVPGYGGGLYLQHQLMMLDGYNCTKADGMTVEGQASLIHRELQAQRTSFCFMAKMQGDGDKETKWLRDAMRNPAIVDRIRSRTPDYGVLPMDELCDSPDFTPPDFNGTSHYSITDQYGNVLALTASIHNHLGSTVMGSRTGLVFNDAVNDFADPYAYRLRGLTMPKGNRPEPGATAQGMQTPTIVTDREGNVRLVTGAAGGGKIVITVASLIKDVLLLDKSVKEATDSARIYVYSLTDDVSYSIGFPQAILQELRKRGNTPVELADVVLQSCIQTIAMNDGWLYPYSDQRRQGCSDGF